jgi:hypothetical protein
MIMSAALTRAAMKMGSAIARHGVFMVSRIYRSIF